MVASATLFHTVGYVVNSPNEATKSWIAVQSQDNLFISPPLNHIQDHTYDTANYPSSALI
eukprot:4857783-Amphidinium_carterae.1